MLSIKKCIKIFLPERIKKTLRVMRQKITPFEEYMIIKVQPLRHKRALKRVKNKSKRDKIKVAFFAIHSSVWKYDGVYRLMEEDERFDPIVVVCPVVNYGKKNMLEEMEKTYKLFEHKGYNVIKTYNKKDDNYLDVKKEIAPDIIFYTNPHQLTKEEYYITRYKDTLSCYTQYSFHVTHLNEIQYNQLFHNILWKAFYETDIHKKMACQYSRNKGKNVTITGYSGIDSFNYGDRIGKDVWKHPDENLRRIIWAPHHTIEKDELSYSSFLIYHQVMLDIVEKYKEKIQIAFKPHPLLKVKLNKHYEWGQKRTEDYYKKWEDCKNGQLETDAYVALFNTSDAMVFDSASFIAEYLYCGKPSLFTLSDLDVKDRFNEFGKLAYEQHYHACNETDIVNFFENVVCVGRDIMKENRDIFYANYLIPPNNKTASENIYYELCKEIFK